ncbi:MAG: hypothetical protein NUV77_13615 [Thermoguttaceae bacterium]|jgi:hypothetical protein|nr:hypothetical protein [Thermoguttaceae bacterium]
MAKECYVLDTSAMVDLHDHFRVTSVRKTLGRLCRENRLRLPEGVKRELGRKTDQARKTVGELAKQYPGCVVLIQAVPNLGGELARMEQTYGQEIRVGNRRYPGFWKSRSGHKAIDGQLVSVGKRLACTVVSDDRAVRMACLLENVPCIGWAEFARQVGLSQPTLF